MKRRRRPALHIFFLLACAAALPAGCNAAGGRTAALGEQFKLGPEESVAVRETNLAVQLKGTRRTWYVDGKSETAEADLRITLGGEEKREWLKVGEETAVGAYTVKAWGVDPFGKGSATLIVTRGG